jgi:hypothetical protein
VVFVRELINGVVGFSEVGKISMLGKLFKYAEIWNCTLGRHASGHVTGWYKTASSEF